MNEQHPKLPEQINWRLEGDKDRADALRGLGLQLKGQLQRENAFDYSVFSRRYVGKDGTTCTVERNCGPTTDVYTITLYCQPSKQINRSDMPNVPALELGQFFYIPGCVARYDAHLSPSFTRTDAFHWMNSIKKGALANEVLSYKPEVDFGSRDNCGLPAMQSMGEAGVVRNVGVYTLPGGINSGMYLSRKHLPDNSVFSCSCAFRLNSKLEYDYSFDEREVLNPVRSYCLKSSDGDSWAWDCPGSLSPIIGWASPQYFTTDQEHVTFPWAPWNDDFTNESLVTGLKAVDVACADAPHLADTWSASSPYWDKKDPPNAYPYPKGFVTGMRFFGLFIYNGHQLLCGRINDFKRQYQLSTVVTPEIELEKWFHAVMVQEKEGVLNLYLADSVTKKATRFSVFSSVEEMSPPTEYDTEYDYTFIGYNSWYVELMNTNEKISHFSMNPQMDVCLPRFYDRSITKPEAVLLHREALEGVFVADDSEVGQIEAAGFIPVTV